MIAQMVIAIIKKLKGMALAEVVHLNIISQEHKVNIFQDQVRRRLESETRGFFQVNST